MINFYEHLVQHRNINPLRASIWSEFVGGVIEAMLAAEASLKSPNAWKEYCRAKGSFGKLRKKGILANSYVPTEEGINGELLERMNDFLRGTKDDSVLRKWYVAFEGEGRVRSKQKKGKHANRFDIRACAQCIDGPELVFEAKIIETESHLSQRLLGSTGLGCFTREEEPYTTSKIGGLLAYVVQENPSTWMEKINRQYSVGERPLSTEIHNVVVMPSSFIIASASVARASTPDPIIMLNMVLKFEVKTKSP